MTDDLSLRERKKRRTRAALTRAALELCAERGVEEVTVADIAAAADVSPRTFFNYFSTKEEAVVGASGHAERLVELLAARPAEEPVWVALRAAVAELLAEEELPGRDFLARARLVVDSPALAQRRLADWLEVEQLVAAEVARRLGAPVDDRAPRLLVATAVAAVRVAIDHWIDTPSDRSLVEAIDDALREVAEGEHAGPRATRADGAGAVPLPTP